MLIRSLAVLSCRCLLVTGLLWSVSSSTAVAVTEVSGDRDANAPLIIDPGPDPTDSLTREISLNGSVPVVFIQRMPVTKVVNEVTIGHIGQATSCTTPTRTTVSVREHIGDLELGGDYSQGTQIVSATGYVSLASAPSKVTYTIPATVFREGRGYSFNVVADYSSTDCKLARQTTWAHNAGTVNAGSQRCTGAPVLKRMWHLEGLDDAILGCVDGPPPYRQFDPSMPTGWLASRFAGCCWDVLTAKHDNTSSGSSACDTAMGITPLHLGAVEAFGRQQEGMHPEWVCEWTQFAPLGSTVTDGWYYALPWLTERSGAPRDMYLKLDTIDYDALLESRVPILSYDTSELFRVLNPSAATDFYDDSDDPDDPDDANRLVDGDGSFASANTSIASSEGIDVLSIGYLGDFYATGVGRRAATEADGNDYLSERGDSPSGYAQDASAMEALPGYGNRVYGRVVHDSMGTIWLQYWLYYYYDPQANFLGSGEHEGDWELAQVRLDASSNPDKAAYAQHGGGETCEWNAVTKVDGHPVVYVARHSHASYFRIGEYDDPTPDDRADGGGGTLQPAVSEIREESTDWIRWPGRWGDSGASPDGPAFQGLQVERSWHVGGRITPV